MATQKKSEQKGSMLKLRQIRSGIGCPVEMRETLKALGFRRLHQVVERPDTRETRGMIHKVQHLVEFVD